MPGGKKEGSAGGRGQNGNRNGFRTDSAISSSRHGQERALQRWVPDASDVADGSLEKSSGGSGGGGAWDQFAENERLFGLKTDYDENYYTTSINRNDPRFNERMSAADRKAREIERSEASTAHVAEERQMDFIAGGKDDGGENEEDKYSGVRRQQDFPPLGAGSENKYIAPAKRAPTSQSTVKGAPVDPAIISSQIKAPVKKQPTPTPEDSKPRASPPVTNGTSPAVNTKPASASTTVANNAAATAKPNVSADGTKTEKLVAPTLTPNSSANGRTLSPQGQEGVTSATSTVERDVLHHFKNFANQQRETAKQVRSSKAKADKEVKLTELKKFASTFKLSTPVPTDLVSIIAKDPTKQMEIQAKAIRNAEEVARTKSKDATSKTKAVTGKEGQAKAGEQDPSRPSADTRPPKGPNATQIGSQGNVTNRHAGPRPPFQQQQYAQYRNNRPQQMSGHQPQTGNLAQRLRNADSQNPSKFGVPPATLPLQHDGRMPPTGPAGGSDSNANRRLSGVPSHMGAKLNPNSSEFRPNAFAPTFNPGQSSSSSPRPATNAAPETTNAPVQPMSTPGSMGTPVSMGPPPIRRKTKNVSCQKCNILSTIKAIEPPPGRKWDDNGGLRPSYDTPPTWRQFQDDESPDSTMHLTVKELFERQPFGGSSMATPSSSHVAPHLPHQHQLPFHLQQGNHNMGPRQSPHLPHMQMHGPQHGPGPYPQFGHDDHRMVHSNSSQSFASPRMPPASMAYPAMNSPAQLPSSQSVYMGPGTPQMNQYRNFSNQYMPHGQMGGPMMMQPHFMPGPQGMVGNPQMMYPGGNPQFMPHGGPPQQAPGANGYPSPGRPVAPMMTHQGSQQGQSMYGMSPSVQYSQPSFGPGHHQQQQQPAGPMSHPRGYSNAGPQHFGTSPHQHHSQAGHQQRRGSHSFSRNSSTQGHPPPPQPSAGENSTPQIPSSQPQVVEGSDGVK